MAFITCTFRSNALKLDTAFNAVIPDDATENTPTVYLLHGLNGDHTAWMRHSCCERYARERGLALIMPDAGRSFYTDMAYGPAYYTYISRELVDYTRRIFRLSDKRENTFVCGLSMGGYGAFKLALSNPRQYDAAASLSGCLDIEYFAEKMEYREDTRLIWGPKFKPEDSKDSLFYLAEKLEGEGQPKPRLRQYCGTEDSLMYQNAKFRKFIEPRGYDYAYTECPGGHVWTLWDGWLPSALDFFLKR